MKKRIISISILIFLLSCGPYVWFKQPQPQGKADLKSFPEKLLGKYISVTDSSVIRIDSFKIVKEYRENLLMTKDEFKEETGDTIPADTSFIFATNWNISIHSFNDSIELFSSCDDVLFSISERNILKEYKGYYFLNLKDTNNYWQVNILRLEKDTLEFDDILTEKDIKNIKNRITVEVLTDSSEQKQYILNPSKRQIRKILKTRSSGEKFVRSL